MSKTLSLGTHRSNEARQLELAAILFLESVLFKWMEGCVCHPEVEHSEIIAIIKINK